MKLSALKSTISSIFRRGSRDQTTPISFSSFLENYYKTSPSLMSTHYSVLSHLISLQTKPSFTVLHFSKPPINLKHRAILVDWLISAHNKFKLETATLHLCINIIDRFLSSTSSSKSELQLVGVSSLLIASKIEDIHPPCLKNLEYISAGACPLKKILTKESEICVKLNFDFSFPTLYSILSHLLQISAKPYFEYLKKNSPILIKENVNEKNKRVKKVILEDRTNKGDTNKNFSKNEKETTILEFEKVEKTCFLLSEIFLLDLNGKFNNHYSRCLDNFILSLELIYLGLEKLKDKFDFDFKKIKEKVFESILYYIKNCKIGKEKKEIYFLELEKMSGETNEDSGIRKDLQEIIDEYKEDKKYKSIKEKYQKIGICL